MRIFLKNKDFKSQEDHLQKNIMQLHDLGIFFYFHFCIIIFQKLYVFLEIFSLTKNYKSVLEVIIKL